MWDVSSAEGLGEEFFRAFVPEDVEENVFVGGVDGMAVAFPIAHVGIEFDGAALGRLAVEGDRGGGEVGAGFSIPFAELDDFEGIAGEGGEFAAKFAGEPSGLDFEFGGGGERLGGRGFLDRGVGMGQPGLITIGGSHSGILNTGRCRRCRCFLRGGAFFGGYGYKKRTLDRFSTTEGHNTGNVLLSHNL